MARRGMLVFNINYRLSPRHPFPAALTDCSAALEYVVREAPRLGGDLSRLVLAGESAGANLVTALTLMSCVRAARAVGAAGLCARSGAAGGAADVRDAAGQR